MESSEKCGAGTERYIRSCSRFWSRESSRPAEQQPGSDGDGTKRSQPGQQRIYRAADRTGLWGKEHRKNYRHRGVDSSGC
ncbi:hypothetical protein JOQ06_020457 [Pogonophryne albipinna]|uniref:Uncharacterized protein n=1 Tax=Pogonophryne albipinna TaxID=1090488 RepID=A0AAD6FVK0_9TELE|nr:hypothetical protein JOQ06_020457 [Pogonophryne albipinna]